MPNPGIAPTKAELGRQRSRLEIATHAHELLKARRDETVRFLADMDRRRGDMRSEMEAARLEASETPVIVSALYSPRELEQALLLRRVDESGARGENELDEAHYQISVLAELQADIEEYNRQVLPLKTELESLNRRVNVLEFVVIPETEENIRYIMKRLGVHG